MALGTIGKFERIDVLGHGASGIVYLARDTLLRRQVAIKEVSAQGEERERFLEEARVLDRLRHPNIVAVQSVDTISGKIVIAMEYVDGDNLLEILRSAGGPLPVAQAVDITIQVCDGLAYAQERHVVHRDIKPANILVARGGQVKLVDFGLAQVLGTNSFVGGAGTYAYMAPEDFEESEASDAQADIWAVGVILYEMLTGRRPFSVARPKDPFAWKRAVESEPITPPAALRLDVPPLLSEICLKALARDRATRYRSAGDMAAALRRVPVDNSDGGWWEKQDARSASYKGNPETSPPSVSPRPLLIGASDVDTFLSIAPDNWHDARAALVSGELARWLWETGEELLAELAQKAATDAQADEADEDALLRDFLYRAGLDTAAAAHRAASAGSSFLRAGAVDDAIESLMQAIRLDPSHPAYFLQLYKALKQSSDSSGAEAALERGLTHHPRDRALRREYGKIAGSRPASSVSSVDFGTVRHGEQARAQFMVRNPTGSAEPLQGRIASLPAWLDATPTTFTTRKQQPIMLVADTEQLWERRARYDGRIEIETSGGMLDVDVSIAVRPPQRTFQEVFLWYMPLLVLVLAPLLGGELATLRHHPGGVTAPFYAAGMLASGLLYAALWKVCAAADTGRNERLVTGLGTLLAPLGAWLLWLNRDVRVVGPAVVSMVTISALLWVLQGFAMLRSPQTLGRWQVWGGMIGAASLLLTSLLWAQAKAAIGH